uniref:NADH-ubiquinone oxidoreductase chain 6 n=1 Tax=Anthocharis bambusarum TaxID=385382 RepID=A0A088B0Z5_ANTBA|nr:NADH dehydrogenase subunit 6 [Anthocharis bambusarum]AGG40680.1 NADH dehydrogenase subunit 6 [Anthocharis bambusarum]
MLKLFILMIIMFFSLFMFFMINPLAMGLFILLQTMLLSLLIGMFINTYWFSYILFLIFLGGLLVLFIYVASIASNELMNFSIKMKISFWFSILFSLIISFLYNKNLYFFNLFYNNEMTNLSHYFLFFNDNKINLSKLYDKQTYFLNIMLIIYLFITLIAVIKITNIFFGPLRSFN